MVFAIRSQGTIQGDAGNDYFFGFIGTTLSGGLGNDVYRIDPIGIAEIKEYYSWGTDAVQISTGYSYTLPSDVENLAVGSYSGSTTGTANLTGNASGNNIIGWSNAETMNGLGGDDKLIGKGGSDTLNGGDGNDLLDGGTENDTLDGGNGNDTLNGRAGVDVMAGGAGDDIYYVDSVSDSVNENAGEGTDWVRTTIDYTLSANVENGQVWGSAGHSLYGNDLNNLLYGGSGNDFIFGGNGADIIKGANGEDSLWGSWGNDTILGNAGIDVLGGQGGADTLTGGDGEDTFLFQSVADSAPGSSDAITDFSGTGDILDLTSIDPNTSIAGDQAFTFNNTTATAYGLWWSYVDNGDGTTEVTLYGDTNGNTTAELEIHIHLLGSIGSMTPGIDILL
jgi:Ca2+-binding RTX toxin-like protein